MDRVHPTMKACIVTLLTVLTTVNVSAVAPVAPSRGRLLKVPKVYNALITSDIPLLPSRAETAATAAVGSVLLYPSHLPVILQPQAAGATPQQHLEKLSQLQNQLQQDDLDQYRQIQLPSCCFPQLLLNERQPKQPVLEPPHKLLEPPHKLLEPPLQEQLFPKAESLEQHPYPAKQAPVSVHQQLFPEHQLPVQRLPVRHEQQPFYPQRQLSVQQQLFPERQQLSGSHHQPLQVQQVPVQHLSTEQLPPHLTRQQYDAPYQRTHPTLQQHYPQVNVQLQQQQLQLQVQQRKQLELSQFDRQQKEEQDTSYLPMPEMHSYQPPPSVHIDDIKNNRPSNADIPDVPPPPLPVGKRLQPYSYNSPRLSPPPQTNQYVPYR